MKRLPVFFAFLVAGLTLWSLLTVLGTTAMARNLPASSVLTVVGAMDQSDIAPVLDEFTNRTGISTTYQTSGGLAADLLGCAAAHTCPDIAIMPNPGLMAELANQGAIVALDAVVPDFDTHYSAVWQRIGSVGHNVYGIPVGASSKSLMWYRPQAFDALSLTVPATWSELITVANTFVANTQTPFSIGAESGYASGWPLTDIVENILIRVAGPNVDRQLVHHQIAWTDPAVVETFQRFADIVGRDDYQLGGITGTLQTSFIDALDAVFGASPQAAMYFGASFDALFLSPNLTPTLDYDVFTYPEIDPAWGQPIVGGGDVAVLFNTSPEAKSLIQFLASPDAGTIWASNGVGHISPNTGVSLTAYSNLVMRAAAEQITGASDFVFDLDDQLPSELQQYEWGALLDFVAHQDQLLPILQGLEDKATELQGTPCTVDPVTAGSLTYTDTQQNPTVIQLPAGAVTTTTSLAYSPIISLTPPVSFSLAGHAFVLEAYQAGAVVPGFTFQIPVTVTIHYSDEDVAGMQEDQLALLYWQAGDWLDAACGPYDRHPAENWLAVPICHLSQFALFGQYQIYLPLVQR